jgi:hypothetical protein
VKEQLLSLVRDQIQTQRIGKPVDREQLDQLIAVGHFGAITEHAPVPAPESVFFILPDPEGSDFNVRTPDEDAPERRPVLVVYASAGLLSRWDRLEEDLDGFLRGRQQVVVVFLQERFARLSFEAHAYFLSRLLSALPRRKFVAHLAVYVSRDGDGDVPRAAPAAPRDRGAAIDPRLMRLLRGSCDDASRSDAPQCFSALVLSVTPRNGTVGAATSRRAKASAVRDTAASLIAAYWRLWLIRAIKVGRAIGARQTGAGS